MEQAEKFGAELKALRNEKKMTLTELGEKSGYTQAYLSMLENGKKSLPKPRVIKSLASSLGVPHSHLMELAGYTECECMDNKEEGKVGVMPCEDCNKYNKAMDIYDMFDWQECFRILGFDKETKEILISEKGLMRIIQMVNPAQDVRKIRLVSKEAFRHGAS